MHLYAEIEAMDPFYLSKPHTQPQVSPILRFHMPDQTGFV